MRKANALNRWTWTVACGLSVAPLAVAQAPAARPPVPDLGDPYVTTCLVSACYTEPAPAPAAPHTAELAVAIKKSIERTCGSRISNVLVVLVGNKATVHLTAPSEDDARLFWQKIEAMPELRLYQLDAEVAVAGN